MLFKPLEESVRAERLEFLVGIGLGDLMANDSFKLPDVGVMLASYKFFSELGVDVVKIFRDRPSLLGSLRNSCLEPKLRFLTQDVGLSRDKVAKAPELFSRSIDTMVDIYIHFLIKFGENEGQVKKMFSDATTLLGNKIDLIDDKIRKYNEAGIDFHRNYTLLEMNPDKAIDTRNYLNELRILPPEKGKWYHMLLVVSRDVLKPKVEYCAREMIDWTACPRVLVLGLGTEEKPGALPRRVDMIKNAFNCFAIPSDLNYKSNPLILTNFNDEELKNRIRKYTTSAQY